MGLTSNSLAAGVGVSVKNTQFKTGAEVIPRKILIIGTYDMSKTGVVPDVPFQVFSAEHAGDKTGFGFMLHRMVKQAFIGSNGIETWVIPQEETDSTQATGSIAFTGTSAVAGSLYLYIANDLVEITVPAGLQNTSLATMVEYAINDIKELPVTAAVDINDAFQVNFTAKSSGPWGNSISIQINLGYNQELPSGITAVVTDMNSGVGVPSITPALLSLGIGDDANDYFFTDMVHGYGLDTGTLDDISTYVGPGNDTTGLYNNLVSRPFRALTGDTTRGLDGLADLLDLGDSRKTDRANGVIAVPGSASHPSEIAAQAIGHMARINNNRAEEHYLGVTLTGIDPGVERWTLGYDNRDMAVKAGISPTRVQSGVVKMQNVVTFYHPDDVPVSSNGYRSMRNISILQNILANIRANFEREKWQGISIVADTNAVTNIKDRKKARDVDSVIDDLAALAKSFESQAWIYTAAFTLEKLAEEGSVTVRDGGIGFDNILSVILSGEGGILNTVAEFDTSIAITL